MFYFYLDSDNSDNKNTKTEKKPRKKKSKQVKNRQFTTAELCTALKESFDKGSFNNVFFNY